MNSSGDSRRRKDFYAFDLQGVEDPADAVLVAVWESREAAERYLQEAPLRREVDEAYPAVTRTMYDVLGSKTS